MNRFIFCVLLSYIAFIFSACENPVTVSSYSLRYLGNDDTSYDSGSVVYIEGESVAANGLGSMAKTGYTFICWNTESDGSGFSYGPGLNFAMPSSDTILYAQWIEDIYTSMTINLSATNHNITDGSNSFNNDISIFQMGIYEIKYKLWFYVYKYAINNGYVFQNSGKEGSSGNSGDLPLTSSEPVTNVNWRDAIVWCNAYSELSSLNPAYINSDGNPIKDSTDSNSNECDYPDYVITANGFSLPTEVEWQFAASNGGVITYDQSASNPNGTYLLMNISDSVNEWCFDSFNDYPALDQVDYFFKDGNHPVVRGGNIYDRSIGHREQSLIFKGEDYLGFRIKRR